MALHHHVVNGEDLMWERLDRRGMDRKQRIEQRGEADPQRLDG